MYAEVRPVLPEHAAWLAACPFGPGHLTLNNSLPRDKRIHERHSIPRPPMPIAGLRCRAFTGGLPLFTVR